ncbi:hypothetical protein ACFOSU_03235 [Salinisphaera aquimarina]|uniref:Uncharacterized protein n=1 Tax=Salinisphaera aquimarina TaxID=2094031 RepID=A0ABV7ELW8_9GAMM
MEEDVQGNAAWGRSPDVLRRSIASDRRFIEITIAALIGHAKSSITRKYARALNSTLIMVANMMFGYVKAVPEGIEFRRNNYALDRQSRKSVIDRIQTEFRTALLTGDT